MADRGFNIRHLVLPKGATLNIPSFTYDKKYLRDKKIKENCLSQDTCETDYKEDENVSYSTWCNTYKVTISAISVYNNCHCLMQLTGVVWVLGKSGPPPPKKIFLSICPHKKNNY